MYFYLHRHHLVVPVANNLSSANDLAEREKTENLDGTNQELDGVVARVSLDGLNVVLGSLEGVQAKGLEGLEDGLELRAGRGGKALLDVDLLAELGNNLRPENGLRNKGGSLVDDAAGGSGSLSSSRVVSDAANGGLGGRKEGGAEHSGCDYGDNDQKRSLRFS